MSFIHLRECLESYNNQIESNKENKLSPHHLEFNDKTGWSIVEGKFSGSPEVRKKLADNVYKELRNLDEDNSLLDVFSRMDQSIRNSFPELKPLADKASIHALLKQNPSQTKVLLEKDYEIDPIRFLNGYSGILSQDLVSEIITRVDINMYRSEDLARSLWMGKGIEDEPTRHQFLQKLASKAPHIVQYHNENNSYDLSPEHHQALTEMCRKYI